MSAKNLLVEACQCDRDGRYLEAKHLYREGVLVLLKSVEGEKDESKRQYLISKIDEYTSRIDVLAKSIDAQSTRGELIDHIPILKDSTGHSYNKLFGKYLDTEIKEIRLYDSYLLEYHQLQNLVMFMELVVSKCISLRCISIVTKQDTRADSTQSVCFSQLAAELAPHNIKLCVEFQNDLHDRKIWYSLDNGYVVVIGRGLDIYQPKSQKFSLGIADYDFRRCQATEIHIYKMPKYKI